MKKRIVLIGFVMFCQSPTATIAKFEIRSFVKRAVDSFDRKTVW